MIRLVLLSAVLLVAGCRAAPDDAPVVVVPTHSPDVAGRADAATALSADTTARGPAPKSAPPADAPAEAPPPARVAPAAGVYVLIAAIDDYPGREDDLASTRIDAALMRDAFAERFAVPPDRIRVLLDRQATRAAIIDGFRQHLAQAGEGGTAIFYYSGHGIRLDDNPGWTDPEDDGRDEAIYVWGTGGTGAVLLDDELGLLADDVGAGHTLLVLDACFSGTGARGNVRPKVVDAADAVLGAPPTWLTAGRTPPAEERYALLAASADTEEALAGLPGKPSLFTSVLAPALRSAPAAASLADVIRAVRPRVMREARGYGHAQTPQAEGRADATLGSLRP